MYDPDLYRDKAEIQHWKERDPLVVLEARLRTGDALDEGILAAMEARSPPRSTMRLPSPSGTNLPETPFFTAEVVPELAEGVAALFADDPNVSVLLGSWRDTLPQEAPFDLLFVDADTAKDDVEAMVGLLAPGGTAVLDDVWLDPNAFDERRDAWLHHPRLASVELWVTPERRALVCVRR